jgi:hypothetical protein
MIFEDDFGNGIDENDWNYEIELGGFGTGYFDWTTNDEKNAYTDENGLHIVPTLTTEATTLLWMKSSMATQSISQLKESVPGWNPRSVLE